MSEKPVLTVAALRELLSEQPRNAIVDVEGCDCFPLATGVYCGKEPTDESDAKRYGCPVGVYIVTIESRAR